MKKLTFAFLSAWALGAQAHVKIEDRRTEFDRQRNWEDVRIESPNVQGSLPGVFTESRQVLLDGAQASLRSQVTINSSTWGIWNRRSSFVRDCNLSAPIMDRIRQRRNEYSLVMPLIPLKGGFVDVIRRDGRRQKVSGPINQMALPEYFQVEISSTPDSSIRTSRLNLEAFKASILNQIGEQKDTAFSSGEFRFDLTAYDDVVCDLLNFKATIAITMRADLNRARLKRTSLFSPDEIERVSTEIQRRSSELRPQANQKVMGPAYLTLALNGIRRDIDQLDSWEFERLFGLLTDPITGRPLATLSQRKSEIAHAMDRIEAEQASGNLVYTWDTSGAQQ